MNADALSEANHVRFRKLRRARRRIPVPPVFHVLAEQLCLLRFRRQAADFSVHPGCAGKKMNRRVREIIRTIVEPCARCKAENARFASRTGRTSSARFNSVPYQIGPFCVWPLFALARKKERLTRRCFVASNWLSWMRIRSARHVCALPGVRIARSEMNELRLAAESFHRQ